MQKISLIITILNEETTILSLLESIAEQVLMPAETIIVDGGSSDETVSLIEDFKKRMGKKDNEEKKQGEEQHGKVRVKSSQFFLQVLTKKGNRSVGRNFAIKKAKNDWIAVTDAGCTLDKNWLKELVNRQEKTEVDVVAGYYRVDSKSAFEEAVAPYVLVMPDKVDEENFLPATRSMLLNRTVWEKAGKFDEKLRDNEDYHFAKQLKKTGVKMAFAKKAVVNWIPRSTLKSFNNMVFRFARGDVYAGIFRPKVALIFVRYLFGLWLFLWGIMAGNFWVIFGVIPILLLTYILWSINKNYRYLSRKYYLLPILQISSDLAVMWGSVVGLIKKLKFI